MFRSILHTILLLLIIASNAVVFAESNLALHKAYTVLPTANYPYCLDSQDSIQLTDGKTHGCIWTKKSTVGWMKASPYVEIVVDLREVSLINEVHIYTVGGGLSKVDFPQFAAVLISDDGKDYKLAGTISNRNVISDIHVKPKRKSATMTVAGLDVTGRYVKLLLKPNVRYLFIDELEIFGESLSGTSKLNKNSKLEEFKKTTELIHAVEASIELRKKISLTIEQLKANQTKFQKLFYEKILKSIKSLPRQADAEFNEMYSRSDLGHVSENMGKIRAEIYKHIYKKPLVCLPANPMEVLFEKGMPLDVELQELNITMWQNEYESAVFNIVNTFDNPVNIEIAVSNVTDSSQQSFDSNKIFTVRRAVFVNASSLGSIADPLVLQQNRRFKSEPGELTQIWLTAFHPLLSEGLYNGKILVSAYSSQGQKLSTHSIELNMNVLQNRIPRQIEFDVFNWAYYRAASEETTAYDLRAHYTNIAFVASGEIPWPKLSADKNMFATKLNFDKLDNVFRRHKYAGQYVLFLNFREQQKDWGRFGKWMTPQWKKLFASWLKTVVNHMKYKGFDYDQWMFHPFDETLCNEFYELAKLIKQIDPDVRIFADHINDKRSQIKKFKDLVDVWCPHERHIELYPDRLELVKSFGKPVWVYRSEGPGRANHPYSYYRLMPWRAFKRGLTGVGFWVYHDGQNIATPWNDTLKPMGYYGVIYSSTTSPLGDLPEKIVPSRRWEAWREGIEDYVYLQAVRSKINSIRSVDSNLAQQLQSELDFQVNRVISSPDDPSIVYQARKALSQALLN